MSTTSNTIVIPAREGRSLVLAAGERLRITTPHGRQAVDFFAFVEHDLREWLSPMHTWMNTKCLHPREGDTFVTRHRNPIVRFVEDGAGGVHDMLLAACDATRYRQLGHEGRGGCGDNLLSAMAELGYETDMVPQPVNFFTHTQVGPGMALGGGPNPVPPGGYVVVEALMDVVCTASACPWDLSEPWPVNAADGLSEITAEVIRA